jgi:hypothetical protein
MSSVIQGFWSLTARFNVALRTAASTISCPIRLMRMLTGPSGGLPCSRQSIRYWTGF